MRHLTRLTATLNEIAPLHEPPTELDVRWRFEYRYEKKEGAAYAEDKLEYVNRATPFAQFGGTSIHKVFELVQIGRGFEKQYIDGFTLTVHATLESGQIISKTARYTCQHLELVDDYRYCQRVLSQ